MKTIKELLSQIAKAIRLKTGRTERMTLAQMATAINGITVNDDIGYKMGSIKASSTGSAVIIDHGLNQVPGAVIFIKNGSAPGSLPTNQSSRTDALLSVVFGDGLGHIYCYANIRRGYNGSGSSTTTTSRSWISNTTMTNIYGSGGSVSSFNITNINEVSFTTPKNLYSGAEYIWIAFRAPLA